MLKEYFMYIDLIKIRTIFLHIVCVVMMIMLEIRLMELSGTPFTTAGYFSLFVDIIAFYINLAFIIPFAFRKGKVIKFIVRFLIFLVIILQLKVWLPYSSIGKVSYKDLLYFEGAAPFIYWRLFYLLLLSNSLGFLREKEHQRKSKEILEEKNHAAIREKERVEVTLAQMQLSPHLLFNTLTFIKEDTEDKAPQASVAVELLAQILGHSLLDVRSIKMIPLGAEISQLNNHISLHQHLSEKKLYLEFNIELEQVDWDIQIPPSILLTLLDNVFRYAVLNDPEHPATIFCRVHTTLLHFKAFNYKKSFALPGKGLGIKNLRVILDYYYPAMYQLQMEEDEKSYLLTLNISL
jgi:two-component system LytT family sensor kinase